MQRIAAIDVGSNAIRLAVADLDDEWHVKIIDNMRAPVRLGQDSFTTGFFQESTLQQAVESIAQFRHIIDDFGVSQIKAVATSAVRESKNKEIFLDRIARGSGIEINIISGEEEARLIHLAVTSVYDCANKNVLLIDIGGGSVEITLTKGSKILLANSYAMGTVRLLNKLDWNAYSRSPNAFGLLVREYVESASHHIRKEIGVEKIDMCIGTGGNVEEVGKLSQRLFKHDNDRVVRIDDLEKMIIQLSGMSYANRIRKLNLRPDRADVILPALILLKVVTQIANVEELQIPNVGLKNGLLLDMAASLAEKQHLPQRDQVLESTCRLGKKYYYDQDHAFLVAALSLQLFDQFQSLHNLNNEDRLLLEIAATLHDIGHFINTIDHDKHGQYILRANHIIGLSERQQEIVSGVVRYHRKGRPYLDTEIDTHLSLIDRRTVMMLTALLRLADAMDASHNQRVTDVVVETKETTMYLRLLGWGDLALEKWSVKKRSDLFMEIFGVSLEINL